MLVVRKLLVAILLLTAGFVTMALPGESTHFYQNQSVRIENQTIDNLRIRNAPEVNLINVTIEGFLQIEGSSNVNLRDVRVGNDYDLRTSNAIHHERVKVTYSFTLNKTTSFTSIQDTYEYSVWMLDSTSSYFNGTTFKSTVCWGGNSTWSFYNTNPASPEVDLCPGWTTSNSGPGGGGGGQPTNATYGSTSTTYPPGTTYPGDSFSYTPYTYTPYPEPTYATPPPYPTPYDRPPLNERYRFVLEDQTVYQDVWVYSAEEVVIRDTRIFGNLGIGWSANVQLQNVEVTGFLHIDQSYNIHANGIYAGAMAGLSYAKDFRFQNAKVGQILGCYKCSNGVFENVDVGGTVEIQDSERVDQVDVNPGSSIDQLAIPSEATSGNQVKLVVENSNLEFVGKQAVDEDTLKDVLINVEAARGKAQIEFALPDKPGETAIKVESRFEKLREFEDRNGNGGYDLTDLVVREYLIEELPIQRIRQERLVGEEGWRGRVDYGLPNGGTFSLVFTTKDRDANQTKIDIEIHGYEYSTRDSQLALQVRVESAHDWKIVKAAREDILVFQGGKGYDGFFSWVGTVDADGEEEPVVARVLEEHRTEGDERELVLFLAYPRARHLVHDPSLGVLEGEVTVTEFLGVPDLGNALVYGSTLVAVLAVLWAISQASRRRLS